MRHKVEFIRTLNRVPWALATAFFLAGLSLSLFRFSQESSQWIDETYSTVIAHHSVDRIVALTKEDAHPPGYYLALKVGLKAFRILGMNPGVFLARLLNLIPWLILLLTAAWTLGQLHLKSWIPPAIAVLSSSGALAGLAKELRGYSLCAAALFLAGCLLTVALFGEFRSSRVRCWWPWIYSLSMGIALWTHLQSLLFWVLFTTLWFVHRRGVRQALTPGLWAHITPLLLFFPWIPVILRQRQFMAAVDTSWMTPATLENLNGVFIYWLPLGRISSSTAPFKLGWLTWGILSVAIPLSFYLGSRRITPPSPTGKSFPLSVGLGIPLAFTILCWSLARWGIAPLFHAPRYPLLGAAFWAMGLLALVQRTIQRFRWPMWASWILLTPWLCGSLAASWTIARGEARGGLETSLVALESFLPQNHDPLYVMPSELMPFYERTLEPFEVRPIEEWPCQKKSPTASILNLNRWSGLDRPRDLVAKHLILGRLASSDLRWSAHPENHGDYRVYQLTGQKEAVLQKLCARGLSNVGPTAPSSALSSALAMNQDPSDSWSYLEVGPELDIYRWGSAEEVTVRFDRNVSRGLYTVHLKGVRTNQPQAETTLAWGWSESPKRSPITLQPGPFHLEIPLEVKQEFRPILHLEHPVWRPQGPSSRQLSFLFYLAWIEPSLDPDPPGR